MRHPLPQDFAPEHRRPTAVLADAIHGSAEFRSHALEHPMMTFSATPREMLTAAVAVAPDHLRPLYLAVRDHGVALVTIRQCPDAFVTIAGHPTILYLGDDYHEALGPGVFHQGSMARFISKAEAALVVSGAPEAGLYEELACWAVLQRQNVVLVETRPEHEIPWANLILQHRPDIGMAILGVRGGTA